VWLLASKLLLVSGGVCLLVLALLLLPLFTEDRAAVYLLKLHFRGLARVALSDRRAWHAKQQLIHYDS